MLILGQIVQIVGTRGCMDHVGRKAKVVSWVPGTSWYVLEVNPDTVNSIHAHMRRMDFLTEDEAACARAEDEESNRFCFPDSE